MLHKVIDDKNRIVLGPDCLRILGCKPGDIVDISLLYDTEYCDKLVIKKVEKKTNNV